MGWLSDLLGGIETVGGIIGTPFTAGGSIPLISAGLGTLAGSVDGQIAGHGASNVLSSAGAGAANQQNEQNQLENSYNNSLVGEYGNQINQANLSNTAAVGNPARFAGQSVLADILAGHGRVGNSAVNPTAQSLATLATLQGTDAANEAASPTTNPVPSISAVHAPTLTAPTQSTLGNALGTAGLVSSVLSNIHPSAGGGNAALGAPMGPTEAQGGLIQNPDGSWSLPPQAGSSFDNPGLGNQDLLG